MSTMTIQALQPSVETIWSTMLGIEISPLEEGLYLPSETTMTACVQITGAWLGAVMVECPIEMAQRVASIMFGMPEDELDPNMLQDAMGEVANMVGGGYKSLLPEPSNLSLPAVTEGKDYAFRVLDSMEISRIAFRCEEFTFSIAIVERKK